MIPNDAGGEIKTSQDKLSSKQYDSTVLEATFENGETAEIAGSYVEFAERLPLPAFANLPKEN